MAFNLSMNASDIDKTLVESRQFLDSEPATKQYVDEKATWEALPDKPFYNFIQTLVSGDDVTFAYADGMILASGTALALPADGGTYSVVWDGVSYQCACTYSGGTLLMGNGLFITGEDTGEPFFFAFMENPEDGGIYYACYDVAALMSGNTAATTHSFSVSGVTYVPIDKVYLPTLTWESLPISNKPFYLNLARHITWDGDITNKETVLLKSFDDGGEYRLCKVSDDSNGRGCRAQCSRMLYVSSGSSVTTGINRTRSLWGTNAIVGIDNLQYKKPLDMPYFVATGAAPTTPWGIALEDGIYLAYATDASGNITRYTNDVELYSVSEALSDAYLGSYVRFDTIVADYFYLHSRTLGSNKIFRISVDDTGTLTATEET